MSTLHILSVYHKIQIWFLQLFVEEAKESAQ